MSATTTKQAPEVSGATPPCPDCNEIGSWMVNRVLHTFSLWNPDTLSLAEIGLNCTELEIYCRACGHTANSDDAIYPFLSNK